MSTDLAVLIGFLIFCCILAYFKVPGMIAGLLDKRAEGIGNQLDEARLAREDAQKLLSSIERKTREVQQEADAIVDRAKTDAQRAADQAKADLKGTIERKLRDAETRIAQAEASASREVRNSAAATAAAAAREVLAEGMAPDRADAFLDQGIASIGARLN